ncbi:MAG: hypothetical protein U1E05_25265 [Patescibacteria group bacterium]|nr:hypothetical protein [Patescibacteria group bacterium]
MEDGKPDNPYRSPTRGDLRSEGPTLADIFRAIFLTVAGFLGTALITGMVTAGLAYLTDFYAVMASALLAPALGMLIWHATRATDRWFGRGALAFGVAWFLLAGGCSLLFLAMAT